MEPKNNLHLTSQNGTSQLSSYVAPSTDTNTNGPDIFSTLRSLATANASSYYPSSTQPTLFSTQFQTNPPTWPNNSSNNWLDQAKLSLLPMYGLLQTAGNTTEGTHNDNIALFDRSIQNAAAETARQAVASFNLKSFEQLCSANSQYLTSVSKPPMTEIPQESPILRTYSHSIASTSQFNGSNSQNQTILSSPKCPTDIKSDYNQRVQNTLRQTMEDFTDFDLQDFEDLLMDKPSTSFAHPQSNESVYSQKEQDILRKSTETVHVSQPCDELANADEELDRLVSLVASQNNMPAVELKAENHSSQNSLPVTLKFSNLPAISIAPTSTNISLNMPQFTPPDSPKNMGQIDNSNSANQSNTITHDISIYGEIERNDDASNFLNGSLNVKNIETGNLHSFSMNQKRKQANSLSLIPKEQIKVDSMTVNRLVLARKNGIRVPIYKQKVMHSSLAGSNIGNEDVDNQIRRDDAYSFDDEFDEKPLSGSKQNNESMQKKELPEKYPEVQQPLKIKRKYTRRTGSSSATEPVESAVKEHNLANLIPLLAEQIRRRKIRRTFINSEIANDCNAAISDLPISCILKNTEVSSSSKDSEDFKLRLPKLIIRIPRRESKEESLSSEIMEPFNKKKKRKKKKNKDIDWTETDECKFVKRRKHNEKKYKKEHKRRKQSTESVCESKSIKEEESIHSDHSEIRCEQESLVDIGSDETVRLHYFERPTERPRRGTYLLSKDDLFKPDCSLWRIDNQNLLQKYLPITLEDGTICYKNSQTYSGWCEDFVDNYMVIKVEYIKQSRSENIVRPLLPLQELFPAINLQILDGQHEVDDEIQRISWAMKDQQIRNYLNTVINIMVRHSITLQFIQNIKQSNDWKFLCALSEIELQIKRCLERIRSEQHLWPKLFVDTLENFSQIFVSDFEIENDTEQQFCQACLVESFNVRRAIQLFNEEIYEPETFVPRVMDNQDCSIRTIDFYVCNRCAEAASKYHNIYHLLYAIFKACENKVELVSTEHPEFSSDQVIEMCTRDKELFDRVCGEAIDVLTMK